MGGGLGIRRRGKSEKRRLENVESGKEITSSLSDEAGEIVDEKGERLRNRRERG